jgi:signal transduction histidine kinase
MSAALLGCMGFAVHIRMGIRLVDEVDRQLRHETDAVASADGSEIAKLPVGKPAHLQFGRTEERVVQVLKTDRSAYKLEVNPDVPRMVPLPNAGTPDLTHTLADPAGVQLAEDGSTAYRDFWRGNEPMRSVTVPIKEKGKTIAVVQSTHSLLATRREMADLDTTLFALIPVAGLLSALIGAGFTGLAMRPLKGLNDSAKCLKPDLSGPRLPMEGGDEFAQLAATFNSALDRTAEAFNKQNEAIAQLERFTGDAGHELRTPLAAVKGNASALLLEGGLTEEAKGKVRSINRSADRMSKLIDDLLLLARQDGGRSAPSAHPVDVEMALEEARQELAEPSDLDVELLADSNLWAMGNADSVRRIFINLWSNAFNYAQTRVSVRAKVEKDWIEVGFQDDGEGIAPEHLVRLGERFYRPDSARTRAKGGTGLGLAIVKSLCLSHGGSLEIWSCVGQGTTATVRLPRAKPTP